MQQFNPWQFASNPQQPWSFPGMGQMPNFGQFTPWSFNSDATAGWNQMLANWQQQAQQYAQMMPGQAAMPGFDPASFQAFSQPLTQAGESVTRATLELARKLTAAPDNEQLKQAATEYAQRVLQINWLNLTGTADTQTASAGFQMLRNSLQWATDYLPPANQDQSQYRETVQIWIDFADSATAMSLLYQEFSNRIRQSFAEQLVAKLGTEKAQLQDEKALLAFFASHYETAFTEWLQSDDYSETYGAFVNACSALRIDQQKYIDKYVEMLGLPSKQEMDTTHSRSHQQSKKIRQLERRLASIEQQGRDNDQLRQDIAQLDKALAEKSKQQLALTETVKSCQNQIDRQSDLLAQQAQLLEQQSRLIEELTRKAETRATSQPTAKDSASSAKPAVKVTTATVTKAPTRATPAKASTKATPAKTATPKAPKN